MRRLPRPLSYPYHPGTRAPAMHTMSAPPRLSAIDQWPWRADGVGREFHRNLLRQAGLKYRPDSTLSVVVGRRTQKMARVEAALLVTDRPLSLRKLAQHATLVDADDARNQIDLLNTAYDNDASPFRIERVATGYQLLTRPEFAAWLDKRHHRPARLKLSPPALETLTIVAYRQPVTRADVEAVRGVQSGEMLKQLMERGLVRIAGEDDSLGRPYLYATTRQFLEHFGLQNLDDLPGSEELRQPAAVAPEPTVDSEAEFTDDAVEPETGDATSRTDAAA